MTASAPSPHADGRAAAVCALLGSPDDMEDRDVRDLAERARDLLRSGASADELATCYRDLDMALRRSGDARGLVNESRSARIPGISHDIKVAVCPGPVQCTRVERARDLLPAPPCAVNGARMHKRRLGPGQ
ncbi:hypothetical protein [Streptomyces odonnellii]|uniref:hypothetical protein n=1 Tax=Streptomyces odonnellii TaxID=1417980 RepID=UPI0006254CF0|nr:hypothetical protein [Streptomyces odonnellii]